MNCEHCSAPVLGRGRLAKYCSRTCQRKAANQRYYNNNNPTIAAARSLRNQDAPKRMFIRVKSRAKTNGVAFNLEPSDIVIPERCPVLGIPIVQNHGRRGYFQDSPSLDRIVPSLGYTKGNVRVISQRANQLKSDANLEEMRLVLSDMERLFDYL